MNNEDRRLGGGGVGSPRGLSKSTLVSMSVICAITLAYAACPYEPHAKVLIYLPPVIQLGTSFHCHYDTQCSGYGTPHLEDFIAAICQPFIA